MAEVKLYGGVTYNAFGVDEGSHIQELKDKLLKQKFNSYSWNRETKLLANFNGSLSGSNFNGDFENIDRFQIYKTIGEKNKLHKVYETDNATQRIIEDFTVGDLCDYQYYVYPVCKDTINIDNCDVEIETISPILSEPVRLHNGIISVIGLKQDENDKNTYLIDEDNVWQLQLNVTNEGYTLNTDKTFYQTQDTYGKETAGNRKQRSVSISGLLGKIDCSSNEYVDTYDYIIDWESFCASGSPKMLIDLRGIITIGDIDVNPTFSYKTTPNHEVSVSFTFTQLNSIDNVDILGRHILINPLYYIYLSDVDSILLKDTTPPTDTDKEHNRYLAASLK